MNSYETILPKILGDRGYRLSEGVRAVEGPQDNVIATCFHCYNVR
jgi:hypothetical protein